MACAKRGCGWVVGVLALRHGTAMQPWWLD